MMKAWLIDRFSGIGGLRLADVPEPRAVANEVVLDVIYAALNPADRYLSEAQYPAKPPLPHVLGRDAIGVVREIGPGVSGIAIGSKQVVLRGDVGVHRAGTFAQRVVVPVESLVSPPRGWSDEQSAGATLVYVTAYQAITQWENFPATGAVLLITGASGGVGVASLQLAGAMGHTVIALSRSEEKRRRLKDLGAAISLDPRDANWPKLVRDHLGNRRVDLAIDSVGGKEFNGILDTLGMNGRISVVGRLAGPVPQFNTASLFFRRLRIGGVALSTYTNAESHAAWDNVMKLLTKTDAKPLIDSVFDFDQLPQAFARMARGPMGKVLLRVGT